MKKYLFVFTILSCVFGVGCSAGYVATRPSDLRYARPVSPGPGYVWVTGEWEWSGGNYHWHEGNWHEGREGHKWKSGYWENARNGYKWHKGSWE